VTLTLADLEPFYRNRPALGRHVIAVPTLGCVYVKNAKAGCSTMMLWLDRAYTGEHDFLTEHIHREHRLPRPRETGWRTVLRMLDGEAYRFTFVRDPLARARSTWYAKFVLGRSVWGPRLQPLLGLPVDPETPLTFEQFVTAMELQEPLEMDEHWRPQHLNLMHPVVEYDFVGRLERFDADFATVREQAGLPDVPVTIPNSRKAGQPDPYDGRPDLVRRVQAIYATDLELYGY
jgi:hypothetical protein